MLYISGETIHSYQDTTLTDIRELLVYPVRLRKIAVYCAAKNQHISHMFSLQEFTLNFDGRPVPDALARLLAFQQKKLIQPGIVIVFQ